MPVRNLCAQASRQGLPIDRLYPGSNDTANKGWVQATFAPLGMPATKT